MKLATFDIFDTCLIRKSGIPDSIFRLMAQKLWPEQEDMRTDFVIQRKQAESKAGRNATIKDIYDQFSNSDLYPYSISEVMQCELDTEAEMLVANDSPLVKKLEKFIKLGKFSLQLSNPPTLKQLIKKLREEGWTVKFLSDMYLPSSFLEKILIREGFIGPSIQEKESPLTPIGGNVIVSCENNARKDTGSLYKLVREKYHPTEWIHFGDNRHSDYKMAKKNGVKAFRVNTDYTPIERKILSLGLSSRHILTYELFSGLMRYTRLSSPSLLGEGQGGVLAADYIAPLYIPFVLYVLNEAKKQGIKRLYFLSRDGYIMQKIAEALPHDGIDLNYLFVSRKSLLPAFLIKEGIKVSPIEGDLVGTSYEGLRDSFLQITDRQHLIGRSVDYLLGQLQLSKDFLKTEFNIEFNYSKILNKKEQEDFLDKIFNHQVFTPWLITHLKQKSELVLEYLHQSGLTPSLLGEGRGGASMVDIGWLGTTRLMINEILAPSNSPIVGATSGVHHPPFGGNEGGYPTFYLGIRADALPPRYGSYFSYFPFGALSTEATGLIENYYSASPWPSTLGYKANSFGKEVSLPPSKKILPLFKEGEAFTMTPIIETNVKICQEIAKELRKWIDFINLEDLYNISLTSINSLSQIEYEVDLTPMTQTTEFDGIPMVKKLSFFQLLNIILLGGRATAFDRGSLNFTLGHTFAKKLWPIHQITGKGRTLLYRLILKLKN